MRAGTGFSDSFDYLEGFGRNNPTHIHQTTYDEVMIDATFYEDSELSNFNYFDLKWLLVFPSPLFSANGIPTITVTEKDSKHGIRLYKGSHEYPKAYKGSTLLWDANDENLEDTGLHLPDKIINHIGIGCFKMIIDYDVNSTIGHGRGYPTGLEHSEKIDVIACLLDEGERSYVNDEHTAWICSDQCAVGEMVTLDESSTMEHTIVRKAKAGKLAFGYLLSKVQVKTSGLTLVAVAVLGDVFRLKLKRPAPADILPNTRIYIDSDGECNPIHGHDLRLLSIVNLTENKTTDYIRVYRQMSEIEMYPESQNCIDLADCSFEQDDRTHVVNMIVPTESNIMAQTNYVKDADGVTYCELPDVAIVNNVRFVWENNKLYMEWDGCEDNEKVHFI